MTAPLPRPSSADPSAETPVSLDEVLFGRRDVRDEFTGEPASVAVLRRILAAGHAAPSVGMTQPWDFLVVTDDDLRRRFHHHVLCIGPISHLQEIPDLERHGWRSRRPLDDTIRWQRWDDPARGLAHLGPDATVGGRPVDTAGA